MCVCVWLIDAFDFRHSTLKKIRLKNLNFSLRIAGSGAEPSEPWHSGCTNLGPWTLLVGDPARSFLFGKMM